MNEDHFGLLGIALGSMVTIWTITSLGPKEYDIDECKLQKTSTIQIDGGVSKQTEFWICE